MELPEIPAEDRMPLVKALLEPIEQLAEQVQRLEQEIGYLQMRLSIEG
jgi:hypothetical protein